MDGAPCQPPTAPPQERASPLLQVSGLSVSFAAEAGRISAVRNADFEIPAGSCIGIVGESGSGKSVTALAIMGLLDAAARIDSGRILFEGRDLLSLPRSEVRALRGAAIAMIFQEPMSSLNPAFTVGDQIMEAIRAHEGVGAREARDRTIELLRQVRIASPERRVDEYPHKLSGGMRQRVMIAMALACNPRLLIADEPTTALDVTVQAQVIELLREIQQERGTAIMLISHNIGLIASLASEIVVMYAGGVVERGSAARIIGEPEHPYTVGLLGAVPRAEPRDRPLTGIDGVVPDLRDLPPGCVFEPRCPFSVSPCRSIEPALRPLNPGHTAACHAAPLERAPP
jgi:peptide/nickel transport system ATP-binding protein